VLCLAFPLHPPGRPERSRAPELAGAGRPVVVVQGIRDTFGTPADLEALGLPGVEIIEAPSDHGLAPRTKAGRDELRAVVDLAVRRTLVLSASGA